MESLLNELAKAQRITKSVIFSASVKRPPGKVVIPVSPIDLWEIAKKKPVTLTVTVAPSARGSDWREMGIAITTNRKPLAKRGQNLRFLETVDEGALTPTAYLEGYVAGPQWWSRKLSADEIEQQFVKRQVMV